MKGKKSYAEQSGFRKERLSLIAAYDYSKKALIAPFEFSGFTNTDLFNGWFEQVLCPVLEPGKFIILDNASFHKSYEIEELASSKGCEIIFLPPYSPDLNPIEHVWANFKKILRKCIKKAKNFKAAITKSIQETFMG